MDQFDQLLTCCICLDRYKTPKLLPCQHSYCMEPCMEGLVDYVKRQVKCPECRAEHRVPYNGIQGFPTNITLQKFLELHTEITGELPDPNADAIMSRCNVCSEKAYVNPCAHCDKKVCDDCKEAHCDILKREISRVNNQVKRGLHRLEECLKQVERNQQLLESNATQVTADIDEIHRRLTLAVKERCEYLKSSVDQYLASELKNLKELRSNLDLELTNIQQNSDLMEKHMSDDIKWDDNELMDTKDIFIKMMDFIRNYDAGTDEYTRRIRFIGHDSQSNEMARKILELGEIKIHDPKPADSGRDRDDDIPMRSSGLARSKSDHRLVAEFRRREESEKSPPTRRRFGESRYSREDNKSRTNFGRSYGGDDEEEDSTGGRGRFRSRFLRPDDDEDIGSGNRKSMHEDDEGKAYKAERVKVVDTEDASRGPLSGCIRLADSSRIIQRLKEMEMAKLKPKKKEEAKPAVPKFVPLKPDPEAYANFGKAPPVETDDQKRMRAEIIAKQKAAAAAAAGGASTSQSSNAPVPAPRSSVGTASNAGTSAATASTQLQRQPTEDSETETSSSSEEEEEAPVAASTPAAAGTNAEEEEGEESEYEYYDEDEWEEDEPEAPKPAPATKATTTPTPAVPISRKTSLSNAPTYSNSYSATGSNTTSAVGQNNNNAQTPSSYASRYSSMKPPPTQPQSSTTTPTVTSAATASTTAPTPTTRSYGGARTTPNLGNMSSTLVQSNSSQETDDNDVEMSRPSSSAAASRYRRMRDDSESFVNKYLAQSRRASVEQENKANNNVMDSNIASKTTTPNNNAKNSDSAEEEGKLNALSTRKLSGESQYPSGRSRYAALKERRNKAVARSKSSALLGGLSNNANNADDGEEEDDDEQMPFTRRFGSELAKSRSSAHLKAGDNTNQQTPIPGGNADDENLSSWARYLKNKYGGRNKNRDSQLNDNALQQQGSNSNINNANINVLNSRNSMVVNNQFGIGGGNSGNNQYIQKQALLMTFGSRGSQPGLFTWPRGIAVGPDNTIVVADSSNHRVQIFNESGEHRLSFGCYGNGEGEFDCLAGVAVNRIGQYIIADRYNHRIQIFDPSGHFLRSFGSQGTIDGKFSYPWGITTDALGFIYVCDKENHRVQIFQSDGSFVGKFGVMGSKAGQLEHPHYIAVSNTNRVIVSDSNNHRIQIFDVNGKVLSTFGSEGTEEGQFKFPRGVAVDEEGYIFVADSGNNRIQIFNPDGTFLRGFGRWGQGAGEFKGLEGIAVNSKGNILVADRENHRVQMF